MAQVIFDADLGSRHALYLWPGEFLIEWGTPSDLGAGGRRFPDRFTEADWSDAIQRAVKFADEGGFSSVIVVGKGG